MANTKNKKKSKGVNPVKVGVAGAAIVAAGAAAVVLSKKGNRQKAGKALKNIQKRGNSLRKNASNRLDSVIDREKKVHKKVSTVLAKTSMAAKSKAPKSSGKAKSRTKSKSKK
jgi:hypothetical protein